MSLVLRRALVVAVAVGPPAAVLAIWWPRGPDARTALLGTLLYGAMPVVLLLAAAAAVWRFRHRDRQRSWWRQAWPGALLAAAATAAVVAAVPAELRVQFDETNLVGCAHNMHALRTAVVTTGAVPYDGVPFPLENVVDKRPPLFPFLVSLLHELRGSRPGHAFAVNAALLAAALFGAFAAVRPRLGLPAACAAPLLLLAVPLSTIVATSAGFDLLAAVLFALVLLAALDFTRVPDPPRAVALLAAGMLFAQARYESLAALVVVLALAAWQVRGRFRPDWRCALALAACPGLLLPVGLLLLHARNPDFYPEAAGAPLLGLGHLVAHLPPLLAGWVAPAPANPLPGVLAWLALPAWVAWLAARTAGAATWLVAAPVLAVTALTLAWFYGDVREVTALRLFLPFAWLTALSPLLLAARFGRGAALGLLAFAAPVALWRTAAVARGEAFPPHAITQLSAALDRALPTLGVDPRTTLWVSTIAQHLVVLGHAAVSPRTFQRRGADLQQLVARGDLRTVLVLTTPQDRFLAGGFGDPAEVLAAHGSDVVARVDGEQPLLVHRLH